MVKRRVSCRVEIHRLHDLASLLSVYYTYIRVVSEINFCDCGVSSLSEGCEPCSDVDVTIVTLFQKNFTRTRFDAQQVTVSVYSWDANRATFPRLRPAAFRLREASSYT